MPTRHRWGSVAGRSVAGIVGVASGLIWLLIVFVILKSAFPSSPSADPHGYGRIFGVLMYVPFGVLWVLTLPRALAPRSRRRGFSVAVLVLAVSTVLLVIALALS